MTRLLICLISAFFISISVGWWFIIHAARSGNQMYQNDLNFFMWSVVAAVFLATGALTWAFYKLIH